MQWLALECNRPTFESGFDQASQFSTEDDALVLLRISNGAYPQSALPLDVMAEVYLMRGDTAGALEEFRTERPAGLVHLASALAGHGLDPEVVLDGTVTPELEAEGWAKDRIRELQELRKSSGLDLSDRISVVMAVPGERADWARTHRDLIAGEILATSFEFGDPADGAEIGDGVRVSIVKA